jgi:hypothetical protein
MRPIQTSALVPNTDLILNITKIITMLLTVGMFLAGAGVAGAAPIAQFDINLDGDLNDNQSGYESLNSTPGADSATQNGITFSFSGGDTARDRGTGGNVALSPVPNVTRDFIMSDDGRGQGYLAVTLSGLLADTDYDFRWHHYEQGSDDDSNRLALYEDSAIPANLLFETGPYDRTTTNFFTDFSAASDALGGLTLVTGPHSSGRSIQALNGFEVLAAHPAAAVPEPSTFAIATLALIGLAFFGRRKRR